ncbi:BTB/POZ domain-containing protein KCTD11 [Sphaerodactylus townsendi]|uniref:BTB/POZ domain-containing protein KCTD11 n=1 Tax=Sphaerodactylus townsendi TaxID=933632 RepID=UPI00202750C9|nr:BTB/POZ domain-containing protein KCTD11 [Sphaerodactylus townsendi]XP_048373679.1 BTB/POZ domain-containing protein KCTD11 [Sphaerodactylus townsendi]
MPDTCEAPAQAGRLVTLNVGGKFYSSTLDTLTRFPDSMLGAMFRGPHPALTDSCGNYFIDRDGKTFRHILNFLRFGRLDLPEGYAELSLLRTEADFYQIRPLLEELRRVEAERRCQRANAVLHADVDYRDRLLHFNVRRGPQNYELCTCSLQIFTANVFCTDPYFLAMLRRRMGQPDHVNGKLREGLSGRWVGRTTQETESHGFIGQSGESHTSERDSWNGLSWGAVIVSRESGSGKRPGDDDNVRTSSQLRIDSYSSADEDEETAEKALDYSLGLSHAVTKERHHLCLEWAPRPPELPAAEYTKQKLCPLQMDGREIQTAGEFLEEVLRAALAQGFRVDSVFPDPADILSAHSLRFVRH